MCRKNNIYVFIGFQNLYNLIHLCPSTQTMPLYRSMKNPRKFTSPLGVLNIAIVMVICCYTAIGFFGYLKYGDEGNIN